MIMDAQKAAGTYKRQIDLQGILPKHNTYGRGIFYQVHMHNLRESPLCAPSCPGYKKADGKKKDFWSCEPDCAHEPQCEHAIIMEAQKAEGTWRGAHAELNHVPRAPLQPELPREMVLQRQRELSPV